MASVQQPGQHEIVSVKFARKTDQIWGEFQPILRNASVVGRYKVGNLQDTGLIK